MLRNQTNLVNILCPSFRLVLTQHFRATRFSSDSHQRWCDRSSQALNSCSPISIPHLSPSHTKLSTDLHIIRIAVGIEWSPIPGSRQPLFPKFHAVYHFYANVIFFTLPPAQPSSASQSPKPIDTYMERPQPQPLTFFLRFPIPPVFAPNCPGWTGFALSSLLWAPARIPIQIFLSVSSLIFQIN